MEFQFILFNSPSECIDSSILCVFRDYSHIHVRYRDPEKARLFYHMHETLSTEWGRYIYYYELQESVSVI